MNRYKIAVNTLPFQPFHATHKNWENGTRNDFMYAINGWHVTELNLRNLKNRINLMLGYGVDSEYYSDRMQKWMDKTYVTYQDRLCGFERRDRVGPYGFAQGYVDVEKHIRTLLETGETKIYFSDVYDIRQYSNNYDGCYIKISK